ncbi:MAG: sn-glycerol-3-phosphate ABC transporter ATP-binding protein UgpC [Thermoleophilia bacterium]|nr:sn-glycerol-3-phosphate ABC transporter ATP-binding protein UgpC [Thermoleophilia bacterium]
MARVVFDHVTKRFGDTVVAVDDLSLEIADGEFMILVGPSGCGKTTALRMVAGLEDITSGEVRIGERVVNDLEPKERDVAMVFQSYALYPHMTVQENIAFPLRMQKLARPEVATRVGEAAQLLGLEELLERKPRELSGGQRQRVAMGRAIVRHPRAFLMDEPLSNLDAKLRVQMRAELVRLHRRLGATTLFVTHDQTEAMTLGQRVAVLDRGLLQQVDTPQRLYQRPANTFVAGFIGSPPMNFLAGTLAAGTVEAGGHRFELPQTVRERLERDGGPVLLGIRPEDFHDARLADGSGVTLPAEIEITEQLGPETYAYFRLDGLEAAEVGERPVELAGAFAARLDPRTKAAPGERLLLVLDVDQVHLFDADSGRSILGG